MRGLSLNGTLRFVTSLGLGALALLVTTGPVVAEPAAELVVATAAVQAVVAVAADQPVIAVAAEKAVVAPEADQPVVAAVADERVVVAAALEHTVAIAVDEVMSIAALAKFMGMDRSTLTRNLRPLERDGLIRLGSEGWRRSRTVEITKKGRSRLRDALPLWEKAQETLRRKLGDRRWDHIHDDLDAFIRAA